MAYTYDKQLWKDYPDTTTPITADRLNHMEEGIFNAAKNGGGESDKIGVIKMFSGSTAPDGWLICDGSLISRTDYSGLFNVIGTSYNLETDTDDTKFRLPNLKGRVPVGLDSEDTDFNTLGKTSGEKTHTLTVDEMPSHTHKITRTGSVGSAGYNSWYNSNNESSEKMNLSSTGGGQPHNNLQPYIVLNYIIKASATTSTQGEIIDSLDGDSTTNAPSVHAVKEFVNEKSMRSYYSEKTRVGTWKDGRAIYNICLTITTPTTTGAWKTIYSPQNVDIVVDYGGQLTPNGQESMLLPRQNSTIWFRRNSEFNIDIAVSETYNLDKELLVWFDYVEKAN